LKENFFLSATLFLLPISVGISSYALIGALAYSLCGLILNTNKTITGVNQHFGLCLIAFAYIVFNCWLNNSWQLLPRYIPIVFLPVIAFSTKLEDLKDVDYFKYLNLGLIISVLLALSRYIVSSEKAINYLAIEGYLSVHPTYFSLFLILSINNIIFNLKELNKSKFVLLSFFTAIVLFVQSRIALIALGATVLVYLLQALSFHKKKGHVFLFAIGLFLSIFVVQGKIQGKTTFEFALAERFQIWNSAVNAISEKPFIGYGTDREYDVLGKDYFFNAKLNLLDERYNSHNNFLSISLQLGVIALFLLVLVFIFPFVKYEFKTEYFSFLLIVILFSLTESLIHRHWGLIIVLIGGIYAGKMASFNRD
jgi:hypothetical protein